jgi:hypothetical protein
MTARIAPVPPTAINLARDGVNVAETAMSFVEESIQPVINALEALANFDASDLAAFRQRMREIQALAKVGRRISEDAHNCLDCEREDMQGKLATLQGVAA